MEDLTHPKKYASWQRIDMRFMKKAYRYFIINLVRAWIMPPQARTLLLKHIGVQFTDVRSVFIGVDVTFDTVTQGRTYIGQNVTITTGVKIMNHFIQPTLHKDTYTEGDVCIEDNVFIGMNSLIVKPVRIGKGAMIAAGTVVTTDVPPNAVFGGVPGKVIGTINA